MNQNMQSDEDDYLCKKIESLAFDKDRAEEAKLAAIATEERIGKKANSLMLMLEAKERDLWHNQQEAIKHHSMAAARVNKVRLLAHGSHCRNEKKQGETCHSTLPPRSYRGEANNILRDVSEIRTTASQSRKPSATKTVKTTNGFDKSVKNRSVSKRQGNSVSKHSTTVASKLKRNSSKGSDVEIIQKAWDAHARENQESDSDHEGKYRSYYQGSDNFYH